MRRDRASSEIRSKPDGKESAMANASKQFIGQIAQLAGVGSVVAGVVMSLHHVAAAVALVGGGAAYYIGKKLRAQ